MTMQPTPTVTDSDVERVVRRDYPAGRVPEVFALLKQYGTETWHGEPHRVRLAALKLSAGDIERLRYQIEGAKCDYRDVLAEAEYPEYTKRMFRIRQLRPEEQHRIIDADWKQYQDWLTR